MISKVSRLVWARLGAAVGAAMSATGIGYLFGLGWALIVGGAAVCVYFLLLFDVDQS